jgi:hypothetical protein
VVHMSESNRTDVAGRTHGAEKKPRTMNALGLGL